MEGVKYDAGKVQMELLDPSFLEGTAAVLTFGAAKYDAYNWAKGMQWSRVFGALMRHMWKFWRGQELDEETGISHLYHASCCLMFLAHYQKYKVGEDNRWKGYNNNKEQHGNSKDSVESVRLSNLQKDLQPETGWTGRAGGMAADSGPSYPGYRCTAALSIL